MRTRFAADEKANNYKTSGDSIVADNDDSDKRDAIKGYIKLTIIILVFVAYLIVKNNYFDIVFVSGKSMENSFFDGDVLVMDVISDAEEVSIFDVVVVKVSGMKMIKRVVGLPQDFIELSGDELTVNGEKLNDVPCHSSKKEDFQIQLGENEYFLLGDNLDESRDGRTFGAVGFDSICGIVKYQIYPFSEIGSVEHLESRG